MKLLPVAALAASLMVSAPASAALMMYDFTIGGFSGGGSISGSFAGEDTNGDGALTDFGAHEEISQLSGSFSGNATINPFTFSSADFAKGGGGFIYSIGATDFSIHDGQEQGFVFYNPGIYQAAGGTALVPCDGISTCFGINTVAGDASSSSLGSITAHSAGGAPEPATWAMMIIGFGAAGTQLRRDRRAQARALATA